MDARCAASYTRETLEPPAHTTNGPGSRSRRIAFFAVTAALGVGILWAFREVLAPFAIALVVAYVFAPVVDRMERIRVGSRKMPRWLAVLVLYVALLGAMAGSIALGAPLLVREVQQLSREAPRTIATFRDEWLPEVDRVLRSAGALGARREEPAEEPVAVAPGEEVAIERSIQVVPRTGGGFEIVLPESGVEIREEGDDRFVIRPAAATEQAARRDLAVQITEAIRHQLQTGEQSIAGALRTAQSFIAAVAGGIFRFFIMLMLSAYMLISSDAIFAFFRQLVRPDRRSAWDTLLRRIDRGLAGVVRGQLVICVVNGILSGIGFYIAGLDYWPILALIATVLSIIPIFGAFLSSVPAVIVGLQDGFGVTLFVLAWIIGIHQIEANLLNPKIMGDAAKVHPVLVVFALLAGEHFFGIVGALLAVPVLSISQSLFLHFREVALGVPASESSISLVPPPETPADATAADAPVATPVPTHEAEASKP